MIAATSIKKHPILSLGRRLRFCLPHLLFIVLVYLIFLPVSGNGTGMQRWSFLAVMTAGETALLWRHASRATHDIATILFLFFLAWEFASVQFPQVNHMLYPSPVSVFAIFASDWVKILVGIKSSFYLLGIGFSLALSLGIAMGMITGNIPRLREALLPLAKIISPIPPIIYTPYAVAVLPSFEIASIFVIFSSIFWQVYIQTALSVATIDRKLLDSARTLNLRPNAMFLHVLWPYCLPKIMKALPLSVANAFMVLTAAEMIGATSGLGYFVRYYADFADYTRVLAGIILIGLVVSLLNYGISLLEYRIVRWR